MDAKTCSLKGCEQEACFVIFCGADWFTTTHQVFSCAFDRVEIMEICRNRFKSVMWHDID